MHRVIALCISFMLKELYPGRFPGEKYLCNKCTGSNLTYDRTLKHYL